MQSDIYTDHLFKSESNWSRKICTYELICPLMPWITDEIIKDRSLASDLPPNPHYRKVVCKCVTGNNRHADVCKVYSGRSDGALTLMTAVR